jgi:phosphoribosylanthranilate isomerase
MKFLIKEKSIVSLEVKICGVTDANSVRAAVDSGADYIGFVFYPKSPRNISISDFKILTKYIPEKIAKVGLFVDPQNSLLEKVISAVKLDYIQLHGTESVERICSIKNFFETPVIKAIGVSMDKDFNKVKSIYDYVDKIIFDAKPSQKSLRPGGNALPFKWSLMSNYYGKKPWLLAGGLNINNLEEAVAESGCKAVDVSSGVEIRPGIKDPELIKNFVRFAKNISFEKLSDS